MAGETVALTASQLDVPFEPAAGAFFVPLLIAYATGELELNDVHEAGYIPKGTLLGWIIKATDMDTNVSPTLSQKITVGSTDVVTAITYGQTGADGFRACTPTVVTDKTKVSVTNTAAAATAAAGTLYLTAVMQK